MGGRTTRPQPTGLEYMFVPLIPAPFYDFTCVRFIFLLRGVGEKPYIVMHVEIEQRTGFPTSFVDDEIVECVVL